MAKKKKLSRQELEKYANRLPKKDRTEFLEANIDKEWLEEKIEFRKGLMKRDALIGLPWFIAYSASLYFVGMTAGTVAIFVIGIIYFIYTIFTTGTYGDNRKRVGVYEDLLTKVG